MKSIEKGLGLKPQHIVIEKNGSLIGLFPNFAIRIVKTPFSILSSIPVGYGGLIIPKNESDMLDIVFRRIRYICKDLNLISHLIKTNNNEYIRYNKILGAYGYKLKVTHCKFVVNIDKTWEGITESFSKDRRREIGKIDRNRIKIEDIVDLNVALERFYKIYKNIMIERIGGIVQPFTLFSSFLKYIPDEIKVFVATVDGKDAGAFIYFLDKENKTMYGLFGSVLERCFNQYVPTFLHEYSIKWGMENGFKHYDMGAASTDLSNGLFKYKEQFGGEVVPYLFWEREFSKVRWNMFKAGKKLYRRVRF